MTLPRVNTREFRATYSPNHVASSRHSVLDPSYYCQVPWLFQNSSMIQSKQLPTLMALSEDSRQTWRYKERQKKVPSVEKVTYGSLLLSSFKLYAFLFVYLFGLLDIGSHVAQASLEIMWPRMTPDPPASTFQVHALHAQLLGFN